MNPPHFLPLFFLPVQLKNLLEIVLRAVVAFPCRKGVVMLEYKYNRRAECNTLFQRIEYVFKELNALRSLETE